jgi:hypothetical protein
MKNKVLTGLDEVTKNKIIDFQNIRRTKDKGDLEFAQAQTMIAMLFLEKNRLIQALEVFRLVERKDDSKLFADAKLFIGYILHSYGKFEQALSAWESIELDDSAELYARAQLNIGNCLLENEQTLNAIKVWGKVKRSHHLCIYAKCQFNISNIHVHGDRMDRALDIWEKIKLTDDESIYAKAQFNIGCYLEDKGDYENALAKWDNVKKDYDIELFTLAQYRIGQIFVSDHKLKKYGEAQESFTNAKLIYPYEAYCYEKICNLLLDTDLEIIGQKALNLLNETLKIVEILQLDFGNSSNEIKSSERKLAHYTSTSVANILLENNEKDSDLSYFRLNTINNVNDPSEGHLLVNYLRGISQNYFYAPDFDKELHAFISCFTFNHDSLNQFRLYGKEADKEASGVSLVFKKEFFQSDTSLRGLSFLSLENNIQNSDRDFSPLEIDKQSNMENNSEEKFRIMKQPVMRCVYIDPTSNYIQLAQRNRITFFREFGNETIVIQGEEKSKAEYQWEEYKKHIDEKTIAFSDAFRTLKNTYESIIEEKKAIASDDLESSNKIDTLINEILLPLKYLIKHSAFQEEQECRIVYVTSLNAPEVSMVDKKFLFVEYDSNVKENLNKVYIAPAATEYQLYLAWLLRNTDVKIELSNNPYRQT